MVFYLLIFPSIKIPNKRHSENQYRSCTTLVLIMVFLHYFHLTFLFLNCIQMFQWSSGPPSNIARHKTHNPQDFRKNVRVLNFLASLRIKFAQNNNPFQNKKGPERILINFSPFSSRHKISG